MTAPTQHPPATVPLYATGNGSAKATDKPTNGVTAALQAGRQTRKTRTSRRSHLPRTPTAAGRAARPAIDWRKHLMLTMLSRPYSNLANAATALRKSPEWQGILAYDEFSQRVVSRGVTPFGMPPTEKWEDNEDRCAAEWLQHQEINVSANVAGQAVQTVARECLFHPIRDYLLQQKWDGKARIDRLLPHYFSAKPSTYYRAVGACLLISAVARIMKPGCKVDTVPILESPQGNLKSTAVSVLFGEDNFTDDISDLGTKDAALQLCGRWGVELSELDAMGRAEVAKIKSFVSRTTDRIRPPYGKRVIELPRQCVFIGTTNSETYLRDETGGRRFWPVRCGKILIDELKRDRDQLWAEAVNRFDAGEQWWLTEELEREAATERGDRYEGGPWDNLIASYIANKDDVSIEELLTGCIGKQAGHWTQADKNAVARCLRSTGWERYKARSGMAREWRYRCVDPVGPSSGRGQSLNFSSFVLKVGPSGPTKNNKK